MHDLLDLLRAAVSKSYPSAAIGAIVADCEAAGATCAQIIGACSAGLALRPPVAQDAQ